MADYRVEVEPSARKELERFPDQLIARIVARLENLTSNPRPFGCKKLQGGETEWKFRLKRLTGPLKPSAGCRLIEWNKRLRSFGPLT